MDGTARAKLVLVPRPRRGANPGGKIF